MIKLPLGYSFLLSPDLNCLNCFGLPASPSSLGITGDEGRGSAALDINKRTQSPVDLSVVELSPQQGQTEGDL